MRLLLAEDELDLSNALVAVLKNNNYSVDAVYDGEAIVTGGMQAPGEMSNPGNGREDFPHKD